MAKEWITVFRSRWVLKKVCLDLVADKIFQWQLQLWHADKCTWHTMDSRKANASAAKEINHFPKEFPQQELLSPWSAWPPLPHVTPDTCHCPAEMLQQCLQSQKQIPAAL